MVAPYISPLLGLFRAVHRLLSWCSSFKKYSHTTLWRFLPDSSFTRLNLLDNLSQSMQWTDCPFSLPPSSYFVHPWGLFLTLPSALPSFHSENSLHLLPSFGSQPSPALCISISVCLCLYVSQRLCMLSVVGSYFVFWNFLSCPLRLSPCLLAFSISSLRWVLYAKFVSAACL